MQPDLNFRNGISRFPNRSQQFQLRRRASGHFHGRIPRSRFWAISLSLTVFNLAVEILVEIFSKYGIGVAGLLIDGAFLVLAL